MIHIVGAGWYGCYIGKYLSQKGIDYVIWEKDEIFSGASGNNQNRLHQGFHYPRCSVTRFQARQGFNNFEQEFKKVIFDIPKNYYAVDKNSILDFATYKTIFRAEDYDFEEMDPNDLPIETLQGVVSVNERGICPKRSEKYWRDMQLNIVIGSEAKLDDGLLYVDEKLVSKKGEKIIDCSWGSLAKSTDYYKEDFLILRLDKLRQLNFDALTVMDGPFFSIFPEDSSMNKYTLTSVEHGKMPKGSMDVRSLELAVKKNLNYIRSVYPNFEIDFKYTGFYIGRKLKLHSIRSDSRMLASAIEGNVLKIYSGKIDAIFETKKIVDDFILS